MNTIKALCRATTLFYLLLLPSLILTHTYAHAADSASSAIIVDQFGYLPDLEKIAIIRDPKVGLDSADSYTPGPTLSLVNIVTGQTVFSAAPVLFNAGITHSQSGDKVWHFDFSSVTKSGKYEVLDSATGERSATFRISPNVYKTVLKHAVRTFFYQRAGFAKREPYADTRWAIPGSHRKADQDADAKRFDRPNDQSLSRKLVGGWYDAGDYNKYTNWHSRYIIELLHAWRDYPDVWGDNFNIPKSGNGVPDILDETRFGVLWLRRMQESDGSVLSILGLDHASPPSDADGPSLYGPASTSATLSAAAAYAFSAVAFTEADSATFANFSRNLVNRAEKAWRWALDNPDVIFRNNDASFNSEGLGAGQQEFSNDQLQMQWLSSAIYLFAATGKSEYKNYVASNYADATMIRDGYIIPFDNKIPKDLLFYASLPNANPAIAAQINNTYLNALNDSQYWGEVDSRTDPYLALLGTYTWGSNGVKSTKGLMFLQGLDVAGGSRTSLETQNAASHFLHYIHGVNPLGLVYLSNMGEYGAERSVSTLYHAWFEDSSPVWDEVTANTAGPAPGFLVGGPNPSYSPDGCCPNSCFAEIFNQQCVIAAQLSPAQQPPLKTYREFNNDWPMNSWELTENSNSYQVAYIRLLSSLLGAQQR